VIGENLGMAKKRAHRPEGHRPPTPPPASASHRPRSAGPPPRSARTRFEDASRSTLLRLRSLPSFLLPIILAVSLFLGLVLPSRWSGLLMIAIGLVLLWLTALSWPAISPGSRLLRLVVNVAVITLGVLKILERL
jgi:hypothetical protein